MQDWIALAGRIAVDEACEPTLTCPVCDGGQIHICGVRVSQGETVATITHEQVETAPTIKPVMRRGSTVLLHFWGECGHEFAYRLRFHKGATFVESMYREDGDEFPETLWRD